MSTLPQHSSPIRILALDFDGVICDSVGECLLTAYRISENIFNLPSADDLESIPHDLRKGFLQLRPFLRDGKDFLIIFYFLHIGLTIEDQPEFDKEADKRISEICRTYGISHPAKLEPFFQSQRRNFRAEDEKAWLDMNPLYPNIQQSFKDCQGRLSSIFITTSKPSDAVIKILKHHQINFPEKQIFGKDKVEPSEGKNGHLELLCRKTGNPFQHICLVDDQVSHLLLAQELGVHCVLATWGYNTQNQIEEARIAGINLLEKADLGRLMQEVALPKTK